MLALILTLPCSSGQMVPSSSLSCLKGSFADLPSTPPTPPLWGEGPSGPCKSPIFGALIIWASVFPSVWKGLNFVMWSVWSNPPSTRV